MKILTLFRHAKAVAPGGGIEDHERALMPRGHAAAAAVGRAGGPPELVLCSTALRTRQTLADTARAWSRQPAVRYQPELYLAGPAMLLRQIEAIEDEFGSAWLVGHNPGLHELALALAARAAGRDAFPGLALQFPTAARAEFRFDTDRWSQLATATRTLTAYEPAAAG